MLELESEGLGSIPTRGNILLLKFLFSRSNDSDANIGIIANFIQFVKNLNDNDEKWWRNCFVVVTAPLRTYLKTSINNDKNMSIASSLSSCVNQPWDTAILILGMRWLSDGFSLHVLNLLQTVWILPLLSAIFRLLSPPFPPGMVLVSGSASVDQLHSSCG